MVEDTEQGIIKITEELSQQRKKVREFSEQNKELKTENDKLKSMIVSLKTTKEENIIKIDYEEEYKLLKEKYMSSIKLIKQLNNFINKNIN